MNKSLALFTTPFAAYLLFVLFADFGQKVDASCCCCCKPCCCVACTGPCCCRPCCCCCLCHKGCICIKLPCTTPCCCRGCGCCCQPQSCLSCCGKRKKRQTFDIFGRRNCGCRNEDNFLTTLFFK